MNALLAQRYEARIDTGGLFWGLLWRTGFSGLVFGAMLIAIFGAALPAPSGTGHLGLRGALFGTVAGAIENSVLRALCGLVFFTTTGAFYLPVPADVRHYLTTAGTTCALAGSTLSLADWLLHGCPGLLTPSGVPWTCSPPARWRGRPTPAPDLRDRAVAGGHVGHVAVRYRGAARWYALETRRPMSCTPSGGLGPRG